MKRRILLTPIDLSASTKVGVRSYRKQILPLGSISYKGRKITFDKQYLVELASAFKKNAYDQVPLIFANEANQHNLDPKQFGGEVTDFAVEADGLYATIRPSKTADRVLRDNPRLGVSARIVEGLEKSDGRKFGRAIQHVLLTMDPRVTGMKPWTTVDLSEENGNQRVVDLTALTFEKESKMAKTKGRSVVKAKATTIGDGMLDLSELSDDDLDLLLSVGVKKVDLADDDEDETDDDESDEDEDESEDDADEDEDDDAEEEDEEVKTPKTDLAFPAFLKGAKDEKAKRLLKKAKGKGRMDKKKGVAGREASLVNLSATDKAKQIDLANDVIGSDALDRVGQMQIDLAQERWDNRKKEYIRAGVPPFMLDLAEPLLSAPESVVVDLSNADDPINATKIVTDVLDGMKGMIDLAPELGHRIDLSDTTTDEGAEKALLASWDANNY